MLHLVLRIGSPQIYEAFKLSAEHPHMIGNSQLNPNRIKLINRLIELKAVGMCGIGMDGVRSFVEYVFQYV